MTFEVINNFMNNFQPLNVIIHRKLYQIQFINECARKEARIP